MSVVCIRKYVFVLSESYSWICENLLQQEVPYRKDLQQMRRIVSIRHLFMFRT